ncbi:MAG: PDZ domain-containing protein, partial [Myxococcota bacterium]
VSAKGRAIGSRQYTSYIQTDAEINHGNSGGPLFNKFGEVVGINTAILRNGRGIGFSIPINIVRRVLPQLRRTGRITRAQLGVAVQKITPSLAKSFGMNTPLGALVARVSPGSPAQKAGLRSGDIIIAMNGRIIRNQHHLPLMVAFSPPGSRVKITILRNKKRMVLTARLRRWGDDSDDGSGPPPAQKKLSSNRIGITVSPLSRMLRRRLRISKNVGVLVRSVSRDSPANLRVGDVILRANRKLIRTPNDLKRVVKQVPPGGQVLLFVKRRQRTLFVVVDLR